MQDDAPQTKQQQESNHPVNTEPQLGSQDHMWQQQQQQQNFHQQEQQQQQLNLMQHQPQGFYQQQQQQQQQGHIGEVQQGTFSTADQQAASSTAASSLMQTSYTFGASTNQPNITRYM